jgi:hypothetical protein
MTAVASNNALSAHAVTLRKRRARAAADVIEIGRLLLECRDLCDHGDWLPWVDRELKWSQSTAERFMRVAEKFGDGWMEGTKFVNVTNLEPSSLYLLTAKSTPPKAIDRAFKLADKGLVPHKAVVEIVRACREPAGQEQGGEAGQDRAFEQAVEIICRSGGRADLNSINPAKLLRAADLLTALARRIRKDDPVQLAADRAEARSVSAAA